MVIKLDYLTISPLVLIEKVANYKHSDGYSGLISKVHSIKGQNNKQTVNWIANHDEQEYNGKLLQVY